MTNNVIQMPNKRFDNFERVEEAVFEAIQKLDTNKFEDFGGVLSTLGALAHICEWPEKMFLKMCKAAYRNIGP